MSSSLPIEIFELIIDTIAEDTGYTYSEKMIEIRACSLVCRTFVPMCQRHIFAKASVRAGDNGGLTFGRLAILLNQNVSLVSYITRLVYWRNLSDTVTTPEDAATLSVLMCLPRVQHLQLLCGRACIDIAKPTEELFGPALLLKHYLGSGMITLTTVDIRHARFISLHDILSAPNLINLHLFSCAVAPNTSASYPLPSASLRRLDINIVSCHWLSYFQPGTPLETLCFQPHYEDFTASSTIPEVFPALKRLRVFITDSSVPNDATRVVNEILESVTGLECLVVETGTGYKPPDFPLPIHKCVMNNRMSLKRLHLYFNISYSSDILWACVYGILESVRGRNVIQEIDIILFFDICLGSYFYSHTFSKDIVPSLEVWAKLDELLLEDRSMFPRLEKVSVDIVVKEGTEASPYYHIDRKQLSGFRKGLSHSFHRLEGNPRIVFRWRVRVHNHDSYHFPPTYKVRNIFVA